MSNPMMYARVNKSTNLVVNTEVATSEWVNEWISEHPDDVETYHEGHESLDRRYAGIGFTYDPDTTWFIPPQPGPGWYFDRDEWEWIDPNPPIEAEEEPTK